jgi:hypothetical protein
MRMPSAVAELRELTIDRSLQNEVFDSWRLSRSPFTASRSAASLPAPLAVADTGAVSDYLHTHVSVMANHLHHPSTDELYIFARAEPEPEPGGTHSIQLWRVATGLSRGQLDARFALVSSELAVILNTCRAGPTAHRSLKQGRT